MNSWSVGYRRTRRKGTCIINRLNVKEPFIYRQSGDDDGAGAGESDSKDRLAAMLEYNDNPCKRDDTHKSFIACHVTVWQRGTLHVQWMPCNEVANDAWVCERPLRKDYLIVFRLLPAIAIDFRGRTSDHSVRMRNCVHLKSGAHGNCKEVNLHATHTLKN